MTEFHLPCFERLPQQQLDFLSSRHERVTAMLPAYADLRTRLLDLGGLEVVLPRYDQFSEVEQRRQVYDAHHVLSRGETWPGTNAVVEKGTENNCQIQPCALALLERGTET